MKGLLFSFLIVAFLISCASVPVLTLPEIKSKGYGNEAPIDPYVMEADWPAFDCDVFGVEELGGMSVIACLLFNPDESAEWTQGSIGFPIDESGTVSDTIVIFSIVNADGRLETYILDNGNYVFLEARNLSNQPKHGI